jgi:hypothetical protein
VISGLKHWVENVLWYHYKLHILIGAAAVVIVAVTVYSAARNPPPQFILFIASGQPVFDDQGAALTAFFESSVEEAVNVEHQTAQMSNHQMWQLFSVALISDLHTFFIIGESVIEWIGESAGLFYTARELGLSSAGPLEQMIPLEGVLLMEELLFIFEPMYAMIKRQADAGGELAAECLKALLGA